MEKFPKSTKTIRFQDCDPMSHLNNGRYIDYFMNAREDHLKDFYNLNIYDRLKEKGQSWVVSRNEIAYIKPAFLMEKVIIMTQVNNYSLKHIEVEMSMYNEKGNKLKSIMRSVFIPFDARTNEVIEHDPDLMHLLKEIRIVGITNNIEERIQELQGVLNPA